MEKRCLLAIVLLFLASCTAVPKKIVVEPLAPLPEPPAKIEPPKVRYLDPQIDAHIIAKTIVPYEVITKNSSLDSFGIVPVERYDAHYRYDTVGVDAHVFRFSTREELDFLLSTEFRTIITKGAMTERGNIIALFLTFDYHRIAIWPSGKSLIYIDTDIPDFAALEVVQAYLSKYPSDLITEKCIDSDSANHYLKGATTNVQIGSSVVSWTDTCLRDFSVYKNGQYKSKKGLTTPDGLLEGLCDLDRYRPGFIDEHACPRGCRDGACELN